MTYQRHIDGLRAVAVLSVIFYHFKQPFFAGGFVGVDVFFVISGYLISGLILGEINNTGDFSFKRFYIRRMRRLLPALAVTLSVSLLFATILLSPERLQAFGASLSAAVFSVSNILFWFESGYFDADSHLKPLLHTWSLGVEEQFYFIWPALLWFTARGASTGKQFRVLAIVGAISFGLNLLWVWGRFDAEYAASIFYLTPFRIFELVIGAAAIFAGRKLSCNRWLHEAMMLVGLAMIAYAVISYNDQITFPSHYALAPCLGALLVILARESNIVGRLLTNRLAVGIGLISYSMYLIHWPALVFYEYYRFAALHQLDYLLLLLLTVVASVLMYFFVETPLRKNTAGTTPQRNFVISIGAVMVAISLAGLYLVRIEGATPFNANSLSANEIKEGQDHRFNLIRKGCDLTRLDDPAFCDLDKPYQILVIGNSHEPDGYNAFSEVYRQNSDVNLISFGTLSRCDIKFDKKGPNSPVAFRRCAERTARLNDKEFVSRLNGVVYSANKPFSLRSELGWRLLQHLNELNPNLALVVLGGYINSTYDCSEIFNRFKSFASCSERRYVEYNPLIETAIYGTGTDRHGLEYLYIDKTRLLCKSETPDTCLMTAGDEPAFYDQHHLSLTFATELGKRIADIYREELALSGFPIPTSRP